MPQITRALLVDGLAQLADTKGRQLAELNATLGSIDTLQKLLAYMDLPAAEPGDDPARLGSELGEIDLCGKTTTPASGTSSTIGIGG